MTRRSGRGTGRTARGIGMLCALLTLVYVLALLIPVSVCHAAFPGVSGKIAFHSNRDGNFEIYAMNADGSGQTNLTNNPAWDGWPAWSPDGAKIAFLSLRDGNNEVYVMNADGSGQANLTNNPGNDSPPSWSPDGSKIAFGSYRSGNGEIYVMNADGTGQTNLTNTPMSEDSAAWSPDGSKIAFTRDVGAGSGRLDIYVMNSDGSGQTLLIGNPLSDDNPNWSPDGSKIAFTSDRVSLFHPDIYVANSDGSGQVRLTTTAIDHYPAWSPDGAKIAFGSYRDGTGEIYAANPDGSSQTRLTSSPAGTASDKPDWGPTAVSPDTTPPETHAHVVGSSGDNGWYLSDVTVTLDASDGPDGSGVASTEYCTDGSTWNSYGGEVLVTGEGETAFLYRSTDNEGNVEETKTATVKIDKTDPTMAIGAPMAGEYLLNQAVFADWSAGDSGSGLAWASGTVASGAPIDTTSVGGKTFLVMARDNAGNEAVASVAYGICYGYSGILQPINADGSSIFKLGRTVPVKFRLTEASGAYVGMATARIYVAKISNNVVGDEAEAISTAAATEGNLFRYDAAANQYIFNWGTKGLTTGTWRMRLALDDGTSKYVTVSLR